MKKNNSFTISSLREEVSTVFMQLKTRTIDVHDAATLAKLADTMISSAKVELDYNKFTNSSNKIDFLENNTFKVLDHDNSNNRLENKILYKEKK